MFEPLAIGMWNEVDGILVINMDSSPERYTHFVENIGRYLPMDKVERFSAVPGRELASYNKTPWFTSNTGERAKFWGGTAGCALSHRNAIAYARNKGWRNVMIFEDDVCIEPSSDVFEIVSDTLKKLSGSYLFYLGYNKPSPYGCCIAAKGCASVWKSEGVIAAHAYIVSSELYEPLLNIFPQHDDDIWAWLSVYRAVDVLYRDFVPCWDGVSVYVVDPILFHQRDGMSDIGLNVAQGGDEANRQSPRCYKSVSGVLHLLSTPFRKLKVRLNSFRTRLRASKGGLPGYKKKRKGV